MAAESVFRIRRFVAAVVAAAAAVAAVVIVLSLHHSHILAEVFPCFFLSCKANARVYLAKTGHGPHSS